MGTTDRQLLLGAGRVAGALLVSSSLPVVLAALVWLGGCQRPDEGSGAREPEAANPAGAGATVSVRVDPSFEPAAVVELFTSEGCASCPRADEFVESLDARAERSGMRLFVLAFHVHYWNALGHTDRFSAPRFTDRQRWYAEGWGTTRVYTPQLVIGGTVDVSGNDRRNAILAISEQLDQKAKVGIALRVESTGEVCHVRYQVEPARRGDYLTFALVQDRADTEVDAGENAGRLLRHVNIVREAVWSHVGSGVGTWSAQIPTDMPSGTVVAYVQHARTRRVLGVSQARLKMGG